MIFPPGLILSLLPLFFVCEERSVGERIRRSARRQTPFFFSEAGLVFFPFLAFIPLRFHSPPSFRGFSLTGPLGSSLRLPTILIAGRVGPPMALAGCPFLATGFFQCSTRPLGEFLGGRVGVLGVGCILPCPSFSWQGFPDDQQGRAHLFFFHRKTPLFLPNRCPPQRGDPSSSPLYCKTQIPVRKTFFCGASLLPLLCWGFYLNRRIFFSPLFVGSADLSKLFSCFTSPFFFFFSDYSNCFFLKLRAWDLPDDFPFCL